MPERDEITEFCDRVRNGDICVEYETHYVEFDDYGHFHDDWEHDFYDPDYAMSFISSVIKGCHDLIVLEEFETAFEILDDIIGLEFVIKDHPETDDICEDEFMNLDMAAHEGILSLNRDDYKTYYCITITGKDPLLAVLKKKLEEDSKKYEKEFAEKSKKDKCVVSESP